MREEEYDPELGRGERFVRSLLIAFNLVTLIFSCVLIALGSYALNNSLGILTGVTLPAAIIVMGVFLLLVSMLGALSAYKENTLALMIYFFILVLMIILLLFIGIAVYAKKNDAEGLMRVIYQTSPADLERTWQDSFSCCGMDAFNDSYAPSWVDNTLYPCPPASIPIRQYCIPPMASYFQAGYVNAGIAGIVFAVLMLLFLIFIYILIKGIREKHRETLARQDRAVERAISKLQERSSQLADEAADPTSGIRDDDVVIPEEEMTYDVDIERGAAVAVAEEQAETILETPKPQKKNKGKPKPPGGGPAPSTNTSTTTSLYDDEDEPTTGAQVLVTSSTKKKKSKKQPRPEDMADEEGDEPSFV